jgi:8-oxo-dGTP pyrophosphatase MutT (NUDIX family)
MPRPASTIVVVRPGGPFDVLLVKRNDNVAFMAGAYVFPGGRVDEEDAAAALRYHEPIDEVRFADLDASEELAYRVAAVRELEEEAGVRVSPSVLIPLAHWVTPEVETRRYDTRFFLARMPDGQEPRHEQGETTEFVWLSPQQAVARCQQDEIMLPPPTWTTLKRLAAFASVDDVFAWARAQRIARIQPNLVRDAHQTTLTLPGDPTHPTLPGWDVPDDTRFVLHGGRWKPVRADASTSGGGTPDR